MNYTYYLQEATFLPNIIQASTASLPLLHFGAPMAILVSDWHQIPMLGSLTWVKVPVAGVQQLS